MAKVKKARKAKLQQAARGSGKPAARGAKPSKPAGRAVAKRASARAAPAARRGGAKKVSHVPAGYHAVTPTLSITECAKAIEFYKEALGAKEIIPRFTGPDGKSVWHAELWIGDSPIMLSDPMDPRVKPPSREAPSSIGIWLYVPDCDALIEQAKRAGADVVMAPADMFWGDRFGTVLDPFGVRWGIATHTKDLSQEEIRRAGEEFAAKMAQGGGQGAAQGSNGSGGSSSEVPAA